MQLFLKIISGMGNSVDPDQTAPSGSALFAYAILFCSIRSSLICVSTICLWLFVLNLNFRTFTICFGAEITKMIPDL